MHKLQCHYCKRWLTIDQECADYYATAKHLPFCGRCERESEQHMRENFKGHTFIIRTPEFVCVDKY